MIIKKNTYILAMLLFLILDKSYAEIDTCAEALGLGEELRAFYAQREIFLRVPSSDNVDKLNKNYNDLWEKSDSIPNTELHIAAYESDIFAIRFLISNGMPIDILGRRGVTALSVAAMYGRINAIDFLLDLGANVNAPDVVGTPPLHYAAGDGHIGAALRLLERGADINQANLVDETAIMSSVRGEYQDMQDWTLLHMAIIYPEVTDRAGMVEAILDLDNIWPAIINWPEPVYSGTPLHWAAYEGDIDVINVLLEKGAVLTSVNKDGEIPLHVAAREDQVDAFLMLRDANPASLDVKDSEGLTPIDTAARHSSQKILSVLGLL